MINWGQWYGRDCMSCTDTYTLKQEDLSKMTGLYFNHTEKNDPWVWFHKAATRSSMILTQKSLTWGQVLKFVNWLK